MRAGAINDFAVPVEPHAAWNLDPAQTAAITVMADFDASSPARGVGQMASSCRWT
jgi:hypothetical protein